MKKPISENIRYKELKVKDGVYIPNVGIDYPEENPYEHLVPVNKIKELKFDESYPYLDNSFHYWWNQIACYATAFFYCFPMNFIRHGIHIKGRDILKKYKKELDNGAITICNHFYRWDLVAVLSAIRWRKIWAPVYGENLMTKDYWYIRFIGGIPVPDNMGGLKKFNEAFDTIHAKKQWIHVFPEECRWDYYKPIKPFRKGAFSMAYKYNMPILPCCVTFRPRTGWRKLFGPANEPLLTVTIGEPIFPNTEAPRKVEVDRLREVAHKEMEEMAGITHNPWPAIPEDDK